MTFPHQPGLAGSPWPPTPHQSQKAGCLDTDMESSFPAQQLGPDMEQMYIPREARPPGLGRDPQGCPPPARPSKGGEAWEPGPWSTRPAELPSGLGRKRKLFFFSCSYRQQRERQHGSRTGQLLPVFRGQRTKPFFPPGPGTFCQAKPLAVFFPSFLGTRRCVDQSCLGPLRKSPE